MHGANKGAQPGHSAHSLHRRLIFSPRQALAGRLLMGVPRSVLAEACGLEPEAVHLYETGQGGLADDELVALGRALYDRGNGVIPIAACAAGEGVRLASPVRDPFD